MGVRQLAGGHRGDTRRVHLLERRGTPEALSGHGLHRRHEEGLRRPLLWVGVLVEGRAGCIWHRAGQRLGAQVRSVPGPGAQAWHAGYGLTLRRGPEGAALLRQAPFRAEKRRRAAGGRRSRPPQLREKVVQLSRALSVLVVFLVLTPLDGRGTATVQPWSGHGTVVVVDSSILCGLMGRQPSGGERFFFFWLQPPWGPLTLDLAAWRGRRAWLLGGQDW